MYSWPVPVPKNIGAYTLLVGKVVAFEPSPANLRILRWHRAVNKLRQLVVVPAAVSEESKPSVGFYLVNGGEHSGNSLTIGGEDIPFMEDKRCERIEVPAVSLDDYCFEHELRPDVVKVDVEGGELLVLHGARKTLETERPVVVLAVHPFWLPKGQNAEAIVRLLHALHYVPYDTQGQPVQALAYGEYLLLPAEQTTGRAQSDGMLVLSCLESLIRGCNAAHLNVSSRLL
jgi:FkbM family methyltransferase